MRLRLQEFNVPEIAYFFCMSRRGIKAPFFNPVKRLEQKFGGTHFPYYTSSIPSIFFWIFIQTSNRPLVHRRCGSDPPWEHQLAPVHSNLHEKSTTPVRDDVHNESQLNFSSEEWIWKPNETHNASLPNAKIPQEKVFSMSLTNFTATRYINSQDALHVTCMLDTKSETAETTAHQSAPNQVNMADDVPSPELPSFHTEKVILYPLDVLYVPSGWRVQGSLGAFPDTRVSSANEPNEEVLKRTPIYCQIRFYPKVAREGHFVISSHVDIYNDTESEFLRKHIHKQVRWDEVPTGPRKIFWPTTITFVFFHTMSIAFVCDRNFSIDKGMARRSQVSDLFLKSPTRLLFLSPASSFVFEGAKKESDSLNT